MFFSNPTRPTYGMTVRPQSGRIARCELWSSVDEVPQGTPLTDVLWVQCGHVAQVAPDGDYLCEDHMEGWHCGTCGIEMPEYGYPDRECENCRMN